CPAAVLADTAIQHVTDETGTIAEVAALLFIDLRVVLVFGRVHVPQDPNRFIVDALRDNVGRAVGTVHVAGEEVAGREREYRSARTAKTCLYAKADSHSIHGPRSDNSRF